MPDSAYRTTVALIVVATIHMSAQQPDAADGPPRSVARSAPSGTAAPRILPGTRPSVFSTIQGNALTSANGALANTTVRLRDARVGRIVEMQTTDQSGLFAFRTVDPGSYIVEILGQDQYSVLAASQLLNVGPGEAVSAVVKLPYKISPFAGILGNSKPSAAAVTLQAASAGILATKAFGAPTCDNLQQ